MFASSKNENEKKQIMTTKEVEEHLKRGEEETHDKEINIPIEDDKNDGSIQND